MHLWPSKILRDSFKDEYLRRVERNLRMMKREKMKKQQQQQQEESSSNEQALLDREEGEAPSTKSVFGFLRVFGHSVMVIACTYCCFCCAVCIDEEDMI